MGGLPIEVMSTMNDAMNRFFQDQEDESRKGKKDTKKVKEGKNFLIITLPDDVDGLRIKQTLLRIKKEIQREDAEMRERHTHADWEMV